MGDFPYFDRLDVLERRVTILEGKPDPGLPCPGVMFCRCYSGKVKLPGQKEEVCPACKGKCRVYPPTNDINDFYRSG